MQCHRNIRLVKISTLIRWVGRAIELTRFREYSWVRRHTLANKNIQYDVMKLFAPSLPRERNNTTLYIVMATPTPDGTAATCPPYNARRSPFRCTFVTATPLKGVLLLLRLGRVFDAAQIGVRNCPCADNEPYRFGWDHPLTNLSILRLIESNYVKFISQFNTHT
jgi:hypothetical protein